MMDYLEESVFLQLIISIPLIYIFLWLFKKFITKNYHVGAGIAIIAISFICIFLLPHVPGLGIVYMSSSISAAILIANARKAERD